MVLHGRMQKEKSKRKDTRLLERVASSLIIASRRDRDRTGEVNIVPYQVFDGRALCA